MKNIAQHISTLFAVAFLAGCAQTQQPPSATPNLAATPTSQWTGCWYGEDFQPAMGQSASWLMNRKPNGTFAIDFWSWAPSGQLRQQSESGRWSATKDTYTTVTTHLDGKPVKEPFVDTYEIKSFDGIEVVYFHPKAQQTFKSKKVSCDEAPPSPRRPGGPA